MGRRVTPRLIVALVVVALTPIFIVRNRDTVQNRLFATTLNSPLWLLRVVVKVLAALLGILLTRRRKPWQPLDREQTGSPHE